MAFVEPVTLSARGINLVPLSLDHEPGLRQQLLVVEHAVRRRGVGVHVDGRDEDVVPGAEVADRAAYVNGLACDVDHGVQPLKCPLLVSVLDDDVASFDVAKLPQPLPK